MQLSRNIHVICVFNQICKTMENKPNLTIESTHNESSIFLIEIIQGEL